MRAAALCLALAASACTSSSRSVTASGAPRTVSPATHGTLTKAPPKSGSKRVSLGGASVVIPKRWFSAGFHGLPSPLAFPIVFFSSARMVTRCSKRHSHVCTSSSWFPSDVTTPNDGVLVSWVDDEPPGDTQWPGLAGRVTKIHRHIAKVYTGVSDGGCPVVTAHELAANTRIDTKPFMVAKMREYSGSRLAMTACFGPHVSAADRAAVSRMLHSLRIHPKHWIR